MADKTAIMKEAQKYLAKGQIDKAIAEWEKLVKEAPDGNTHNMIGDLYLKKGDKKSAVASYQKAAKYFRYEGFALKSVALFKKVLNISPTDADALYALGELSEEKGLVPDAIKYYLAAVDSLTKEGRKDRTLSIYEKILSLSPSNIPLRTKVAEIFFKEGMSESASDEYVHIARVYFEKGDFQKAKDNFQQAVKILPSNKDAVIGLSGIYEKTGDKAHAIRIIKDSIVHFPDDMELKLKYCEYAVSAGQLGEARSMLEKMIEQDPSNIEPRRCLADIYIKEGDKERAWQEYLPVIDAMIMQEQYRKAAGILDTFRDVDPLETGKRLVSLYRQMGETDQVASELVSLGDILKSQEMNEEALGFYRDALELQPENDYVKSVIEEISELTKGPEKEAVTVRLAEGTKSTEEIFTEAEIFSRYGLVGEALKLLEALRLREPDNIDVRLRLKPLYVDSGDKAAAVSECLALNELYKRQGDSEKADAVLNEAVGIAPDDARLADIGLAPAPETAGSALFEPTSFAPGAVEETVTGAGEEVGDYDELLAEADFYSRQGLSTEAVKILEKLHRAFPDNSEIVDRLNDLGQEAQAYEQTGSVETGGIHQEGVQFEETPAAVQSPDSFESFETAMPSASFYEAPPVTEEQPSEESGFEDLTITEKDLVEAEEMPEPALDSDVLEIFQEFKKGLEKELGEEDSETHYNLGIAFKEMGLVDDAIKEFQTAKNDPNRLVQASTMLGICYMEKGLYSLAIDVLNQVLAAIPGRDETYWAIKYDLAEAHEKNGALREALELYTDVFGWNARFRNVGEKLGQVKEQMGRKDVAEKPKPKERKDRVSYL